MIAMPVAGDFAEIKKAIAGLALPALRGLLPNTIARSEDVS